MTTIQETIARGETWEAIRDKHLGKRVRIRDVNPMTVNVKVIRGGASQNNRRVRGKLEHISIDVLRAHYAKVTSATRPARVVTYIPPTPPRIQETHLVTTTLEAPPAAPTEAEREYADEMQALQEQAFLEQEAVEPTPAPTVYDFKIDDILERTVRAIKRWGGQPVKAYVITQYVWKNLNAERTRQLVDYGVRLGKLEAWEVPTTPMRPSQRSLMVGLPGTSREPARADGGYPLAPRPKPEVSKPVVTIVTKQDRATIASATIQKQYDALTPEQRDEIARLSQDKETSFHDIQKAYGVLGGVIGMVKREHGLAVISHKKLPRHTPLLTSPVAADDLLPVVTEPTSDPDGKRSDESWGDYARRKLPTAPPHIRKAVTTPVVDTKPSTSTSTFPFTVTVLKMVPTEVTLTISAASFGAAEAQALATEHVTEVLNVSKQRA